MIKNTEQSDPAQYKIKVKGHLDENWVDWFKDMTFSYDKDQTVLAGEVKDQSALHGILNRIRDMNLVLISVKRVERKETKQ